MLTGVNWSLPTDKDLHSDLHVGNSKKLVKVDGSEALRRIPKVRLLTSEPPHTVLKKLIRSPTITQISYIAVDIRFFVFKFQSSAFNGTDSRSHLTKKVMA